LGQQRFFQSARGGDEELPDLILAGGAFAHVIKTAFAGHEAHDQFAFAGPAAPLDGDEFRRL